MLIFADNFCFLFSLNKFMDVTRFVFLYIISIGDTVRHVANKRNVLFLHRRENYLDN